MTKEKKIDWIITLLPLGIVAALSIVFFFLPEQSNEVLSSIRFVLGDTFGTYYPVSYTHLWIIMQFAVYMFGAGEHNIMDLVKSILGLKALLRLLLLNDDPVISILWFLLALLYCYVIYYICAKRNIVQILPKLIIPCLIIHFILGNVGSGLLNWTIDVEYYRNVWFMALPLFSIGHEIKRYQSRCV